MDWSSSRFSRRSTAHTCHLGAFATMLLASGAKYAALADVPGLSTSTWRAVGDPILRIPTLSYLAGVSGDLKPSMRWKLTLAEAGAATASTSALARDRARAVTMRDNLLFTRVSTRVGE